MENVSTIPHDSSMPSNHSSSDTSTDTVKSGKGTQGATPTDAVPGTGTSENGLSTDVGGGTGKPKSDKNKK